jgi:YggT family protein
MQIAITIINAVVTVFTVFIFIYSLLGFILDPFHPIRQTMAQILEPMLTPLRKVIPAVGGLDFSPLILMVLVQIIGSILVSILRRIG